MSTVAAPADRRFRRAHVKPARHRLKWQAMVVPALKGLALVLVLAYAGYRTSTAISHAQMLQVDHIVVRGNERLSSGEVVALLNGLRGRSVIGIDLDEWRQRLLASPWVRDVSLRRSLPSTVEVTVSERVPVGLGRIGGDVYLIDERGQAIDQYGPEYADLDLPVIDGLSPTPSDVDGSAEARADLAIRLIAAVKPRPDITRRLSQIDVSDAHDATVILNGDPAVIHLGDDRFLPRLESYLQLAPTLHDQVASIDYVDLRFDDRIYVRPAGKAAAVQRSGLKGRGSAKP